MSAFFHPHKFHRLIARRGERCRWFQASKATDYDAETNQKDEDANLLKIDGWMYFEQPVPDKPCIFIDEEKRSIADEQFGFLQVGEATAWTMPKFLPLSRPDMIVLFERRVTSNESLTVTNIAQGESEHSPFLLQHYVHGISEVRQGARTFVEGSDYEYIAEENRLRFDLGAAHRPQLTNGFATIAVKYLFAPRMFFNGQQHTAGRPTRFPELLPQRGLLVVRHPDRSDSS